MHKGCLNMLFDNSRNYMAIERVHNSPNSMWRYNHRFILANNVGIVNLKETSLWRGLANHRLVTTALMETAKGYSTISKNKKTPKIMPLMPDSQAKGPAWETIAMAVDTTKIKNNIVCVYSLSKLLFCFIHWTSLFRTSYINVNPIAKNL